MARLRPFLPGQPDPTARRRRGRNIALLIALLALVLLFYGITMVKMAQTEDSAIEAAAMTSQRPGGILPLALVAVVGGMLGLSFAAVPLYRVFCAVTGFGGTPQVGPAESRSVSARTITVRFDADTSPDLPWHFAPEQKQVTFRLGEQQVAFYEARNEAGRPVTGIALYNVTPEKIGKYFHKTACFCFNEQTLAPNQTMQLPVSFWVDPAIATDPSTAEVTTITLSYTFFRSLDDAARSGALARAGPHVGPLVR